MKTMCEMCNSQQNVKDLESRLSATLEKLREYEGWTPHQFLNLMAEHRKLQQAHIALDTKRFELESLVSTKEKELTSAKEWIQRLLSQIDRNDQPLRKDHACQFCMDDDTGSDFVCGYHAARNWLKE